MTVESIDQGTSDRDETLHFTDRLEYTAEQAETMETSRSPEFTLATIALDGCCRTGKGEQLNRLYGWFTSRGIPTMRLKGDGTRVGAGEAWHDLGSRYWTYRHDYHAGIHTPRTEWDVDAMTLSRENRVWKNALESMMQISRSRFGLIIYDRSILSRATLAMQRENLAPGEKLTKDQLYPPHLNTPGEPPITYDEVAPDMLFNLTAPQETLQSRISKDDYDRAFRMRAVWEYYDDFMNAKDALPEDTRTEIVDIDGEQELDLLTETILLRMMKRWPEINPLKEVKPMYTQYSSGDQALLIPGQQ